MVGFSPVGSTPVGASTAGPGALTIDVGSLTYGFNLIAPEIAIDLIVDTETLVYNVVLGSIQVGGKVVINTPPLMYGYNLPHIIIQKDEIIDISPLSYDYILGDLIIGTDIDIQASPLEYNTQLSEVVIYVPRVFDVESLEYGISFSPTVLVRDIIIDPLPLTYNVNYGDINVYNYTIIDYTNLPYPQTHIEDAQKLEADGIVDLFVITYSDKVSKTYLKDNNTVTWQGNTYEGTGVKLTGVGEFSDEESSRPKFTMFNGNGVFTFPISQGYLEGGTITRIRVLKEHLDNDINISTQKTWKIARVASVTPDIIGLELRGLFDGPFSQIPRRMYIPPEFRFVNLS